MTSSEAGTDRPIVPGYRLVRRVSAAGGPTEVWEALAAPDGRSVAIKRLAASAREDLRLRFDREIELTRTLGGRHRVIGAVATVAEPPALVLEWMPGGSLRDRIRPGRGLPEPFVRGVQDGVGEALEWLHRHGVVHRDVKPSNLLFAGDGSIRLSDLGVAATGNPPRGLPPGWVEERIGTLGYAAPALLRDAAVATVAVDDYALAATLYEAVTGFLPYDFHPGESEADLERRITGGEPPVPIEARRADAPSDLATWIMERLVGV